VQDWTEAQIGMISADAGKLDEPKEDPSEPGVWRLRGETIISPHSSREFCATYDTILPDDFYHDFATGTPVMDTTLTVEAPDDLRIEVYRELAVYWTCHAGRQGDRPLVETVPAFRLARLFAAGDAVPRFG
jgi:hypothetical protein